MISLRNIMSQTLRPVLDGVGNVLPMSPLADESCANEFLILSLVDSNRPARPCKQHNGIFVTFNENVE